MLSHMCDVAGSSASHTACHCSSKNLLLLRIASHDHLHSAREGFPTCNHITAGSRKPYRHSR